MTYGTLNGNNVTLTMVFKTQIMATIAGAECIEKYWVQAGISAADIIAHNLKKLMQPMCMN